MIITFDGLDGVGKTTVSKKFAMQHGYKYVERPLYQLFGIEDKNSENYRVARMLENTVYNNSNSNELKASLTGLGLIYLYKTVDNSEMIVLDRGLLSNYSFNGTNDSLPVFEALLKMGIYSDVSFLLYASDDIRINRIRARNPFDKDLTDVSISNQNYEKIFAFINKNKLPVIVINTDNKTIDEVMEEVNQKYEEVMKYGNSKPGRKLKLSKKCN